MILRLAIVWLGLLGLVVVSSAGTDTAKKLVGVWELTKTNGKSPEGKTVVEFSADGKYTVKGTTKKGDPIDDEGKYTLKGDSVTITIMAGGNEFTMTTKVKKLTDSELQTEFVSINGKKAAGLVQYTRVKAAADTAKQLIGHWQITKEDGKAFKGTTILEFTADGKYSVETSEKGKSTKQAGTYEVKGDTVSITVEAGMLDFSITARITKLTTTEFHAAFAGPDGKGSGITEHKRVKK